jgi:hypothetical protein
VQAAFRCNPQGPATDYDRACDCHGWLGVIPVGKGQALVLGGDDTMAAYYHWNRRHFLLRWHYAPSETKLLDHFHDVCDSLPVESGELFGHPGGKIFLMEAADMPGRWLITHTEFLLPRGRHRVTTGHSETDEIYLIVHQLQRD